MHEGSASDHGLRVTSDPVDAQAAARPLVAQDPIAYSVVASVTSGLVEDPSSYQSYDWFILTGSAGVELVCMHTHPLPIYLPAHVPGAIDLLATELAQTGHPVSGANGDRQAVEAFLAAYLPATSRVVVTEEGMGVFDLPVTPRLPCGVPGYDRLATEADADFLTGWISEFMAETGLGRSNAHPGDMARRHIRRGRMRLWVHHGVPVAMCWTTPPAANVVRVSGVYTPRPHRGHGFASAVVEAASRQEQRQGHLCMLFTQLLNPTSNKIYQALGYRRLSDQLNVELD